MLQHIAPAIAAAFILTGCIGPEHYYGSYEASCAGANPLDVHDDAQSVANAISKALTRPLKVVGPQTRPESLELIIAAPPSPSVSFSYTGLSIRDHLFIFVVAQNPEEDDPILQIRGVIERALKNSNCATWHYGIRHASLAGG